MSMHRSGVHGAGSWQSRDFHDEVAPRRRMLERGATAAIVTLTAFLVFLLAIQHENSNCGNACYDGGLRPRETGHAWTGYEHAWQWQAQWALGLGALLLGIAALSFSSRFGWRRRAARLTVAAAVLSVVWIAWRVLEPAIPA